MGISIESQQLLNKYRKCLVSSPVPEDFVVPVIPETKARYSDVTANIILLSNRLTQVEREEIRKLLELKIPQRIPATLLSPQKYGQYELDISNTVTSLVDAYLDPNKNSLRLPSLIQRLGESHKLSGGESLAEIIEGLPKISSMTLRLIALGNYLKEKDVFSFQFYFGSSGHKEYSDLIPNRPDYFGFCLRLAINDYLTANSGQVKNPQGCLRINPTSGGSHSCGISPS